MNQSDLVTDDQHIAAAKQGDRGAYASLVVKYQDRLFNALLRVLGSSADAEDITQDALVQAMVKLDTFQGNSAFYTWLYRIAFNLAMSHARKKRPVTMPDHDGGAGTILEPKDISPSPEETMVTQEEVACVQSAIDQLPMEFRQVVVLRELEGCDYEQIATILELPIGTVRSRLFRARMQLKEKLVSQLSAEHNR